MSYLEKFDYGLNATQTTEVDVLYEKDNNEFNQYEIFVILMIENVNVVIAMMMPIGIVF